MGKYKRYLGALAVAFGLLLAAVFGGRVLAAQQQIARSYEGDESIRVGMLVGLTDAKKNLVSPVAQKNGMDMLGVVVSANDLPVSISDPTSEKQVYVATVGQYPTLVSDQNGAIKAGDYITVSSINGVGMKVDKEQLNIIGKALDSFDGKTSVESTAKLGKKTVAIGRVTVDVSVAHNPLYQSTMVNGVPRFLAQAARAVTNKPVAAARIYASVVVLLIVTVISGSLLYAGVRSAIIAIGRNPLARHTITRKLFQVVLLSVVVFVIGLIGVYLLLRL